MKDMSPEEKQQAALQRMKEMESLGEVDEDGIFFLCLCLHLFAAFPHRLTKPNHA